MSDPKPLTKERREEIAMANPPSANSPYIHDLLAAEQFWREAVKNIDVYYNEEMCPLCQQYTGCGPSGLGTHKPDCRWVIANE